MSSLTANHLRCACAAVFGTAALAGCGSSAGPPLGAGAAARLHGDVARIRAAQARGDSATAHSSALTLRRDVSSLIASHQLSTADGQVLLTDAGRVLTTLAVPTTTTATTPIAATTATPTTTTTATPPSTPAPAAPVVPVPTPHPTPHPTPKPKAKAAKAKPHGGGKGKHGGHGPGSENGDD